jgi:CRP-like cAMP-binding protein
MARSDSKLEHLSKVRLFSALSKKELQILGRTCDEVTVSAGKVLCEEGKPGHEFYMILEGQATVRRGGKKIASLGPGDSFGELALLDKAPRNATVTADSDMRLIVLGQREFAGVLDEIPGLAHKMLVSMAGRLRELDAKDLGN